MGVSLEYKVMKMDVVRGRMLRNKSISLVNLEQF